MGFLTCVRWLYSSWSMTAACSKRVALQCMLLVYLVALGRSIKINIKKKMPKCQNHGSKCSAVPNATKVEAALAVLPRLRPARPRALLRALFLVAWPRRQNLGAPVTAAAWRRRAPPVARPFAGVVAVVVVVAEAAPLLARLQDGRARHARGAPRAGSARRRGHRSSRGHLHLPLHWLLLL